MSLSRRALLLSLGAASLLTVGNAVAAHADETTPGSLRRAFASGAAPVPTLAVTSSSPPSNIKAMQYLLSAWGVPTVADGSFGPATKASVITFQKRKALVADGVAGPKTMAALTATPGFENSPNASTSRAVQQLLVKLGYQVSVDGSFGPATLAAVKSFQGRVGQPVTGRVDSATWAFLFEPPTTPGSWSSAFLTAREDYSGINMAALTTMQQQNAKFIVAVGKGHQVPAFGIQVALATAIVESWLYNRYTITDGTSGGLFQQQTSTGWGTSAQVRNKLLAAKAFYGVATHTQNPGLADYAPSYLSWTLGAAAQKVQRSAYPSRYQQWAGAAGTLYNRYASVDPYRG